MHTLQSVNISLPVNTVRTKICAEIHQ